MKVPPQTQGIAITNYNGKEYLITNQSLSFLNSTITLYEIKEDELSFVGLQELEKKGLEGIDIDENNNVLLSYEKGNNGAEKTTFEELYNNIKNYPDEISKPKQILKEQMGKIYNKKHNID